MYGDDWKRGYNNRNRGSYKDHQITMNTQPFELDLKRSAFSWFDEDDEVEDFSSTAYLVRITDKKIIKLHRSTECLLHQNFHPTDYLDSRSDEESAWQTVCDIDGHYLGRIPTALTCRFDHYSGIRVLLRGFQVRLPKSPLHLVMTIQLKSII